MARVGLLADAGIVCYMIGRQSFGVCDAHWRDQVSTEGRPLEVRCAWCERERLSLPGAEPLPEDAQITHGICKRHSDALLANLPSRSFPGVRVLVVVHPGYSTLGEYLAHNFAGVPGVHVMMDRRRTERRQHMQSSVVERRQRDRRRRRNEMSAFGHTVIRFGT